jgi:hypothetical protein
MDTSLKSAKTSSFHVIAKFVFKNHSNVQRYHHFGSWNPIVEEINYQTVIWKAKYLHHNRFPLLMQTMVRFPWLIIKQDNTYVSAYSNTTLQTRIQLKQHEVWGSFSRDYEDYGLAECDAVKIGRPVTIHQTSRPHIPEDRTLTETNMLVYINVSVN